MGAYRITMMMMSKSGDELITNAKQAADTLQGKTVAVPAAAERSERKPKRASNLAEFFAASPLPGSRIKTSRMSDRPRKLDL
jgi:hypothetical protein